MNPYTFDPVKPIIETKYGRLRGVSYGEVNIFMGVQYAKARRFHQPEEPEHWEGVKDAFLHGPVAPLMETHKPFALYRGLHLLQTEREDCQNLNIWAPKDLSGRKKPVFVWMHGGGFFAGNAFEEYSFDGFNLAHHGDIVFVSVNHRLNILGHFNMEDYGEEYHNSVNCGIADLVMALRWVHENIEAFGGDPDNVTICGHSGGGAKVLSMFQIEEAKDYFTRAICMSGVVPKQEADSSVSREFAAMTLQELGISKENADAVCDVPFEELVSAAKRASTKMNIANPAFIFAPMRNDWFYGLPSESGFAPYSKDKPLMFGTVLGEFANPGLKEDEKAQMTLADKKEFLKGLYGNAAESMMDAFRAAYPSHDILDLAYTDVIFRIPTRETALKKAALSPENTWVYLCSYNCPEDGWIPMWHGGDVCYAFMNEDRVYVLNEAIYGQKLSNIFSTAFLNFIKTGDPNNRYLPEWKPLTTEHHYTMIIDRECELREAHDETLTGLIVEANKNAFALPKID